MLGLPEKPFVDPVSGNELDAFQLADWLEGCITFSENLITQNDVVDTLSENYLTAKTDAQSAKNDAAGKVNAAWSELTRRSACLGAAASYLVRGVRVERACKWSATPAFAFCLLVGLRPVYRKAFAELNDYTQQGALFERLALASMEAAGWQVHPVGWSKNAASSIVTKVDSVAEFLGADRLNGATEQWTAPKAKDAGLDVICQHAFKDGWSGKPIILTQCASGDNWEDKLHTPDLNTWRKLVDFCTAPTRGMAMPFVVSRERFKRAAVRDGISLILDRNRLAVPEQRPLTWLPVALKDELTKWVADRVEILLKTAA